MKKILLASTILVGTAGFAAADSANFSFSGEAGFGMFYTMPDGGDGTLYPTVSAEFTAGMSTTTDMGLEAGASVTVTAGHAYTVETDNTDADFGVVGSGEAGSVGNASVYLSGDFGKLTVEYDGDNVVIYGYSYTMGDLTVDAAYTLNTGATDDEGSLGLTYVFGDLTAEASYDWTEAANDDEAHAKLTYAFGDYSVYAGVDLTETTDGWADMTTEVVFGGSASISGFSLGVDATYNTAGGADALTWKATAGYASGAYSVEAFVEDDQGVDTNFDFGVSGSYDLGGGVSVDAGYIYDADNNIGLATAGVSMSF